MSTTQENPSTFAPGDDSALARILATSAKAFKFEAPGDLVTGVIDSIVVRQVRKFKTNVPVFWDDGRPQEQIVVTIQTDLDEPDEDNPEDDGLRAVYVKSWGPQVREFRRGAKALHRLPREGDTFTASFTGLSTEKDKTSGEPWKEFIFEVERP
jgi:hypothetical protein